MEGTEEHKLDELQKVIFYFPPEKKEGEEGEPPSSPSPDVEFYPPPEGEGGEGEGEGDGEGGGSSEGGFKKGDVVLYNSDYVTIEEVLPDGDYDIRPSTPDEIAAMKEKEAAAKAKAEKEK
jgi:hypothetical protein